MSNYMSYQYETIEKAINYLSDHFIEQPDLETIAAQMNLSQHHFHRMFTEWAGVTPKKFSQFLTVGYAKDLLRKKQFTLFDTAFETGLSGTGRLHDLFISIEAMTPAEYKNGGEKLNIAYSYHHSQFGEFIIASTLKGICHLAFFKNRENALNELLGIFPVANFSEAIHPIHLQAQKYLFRAGLSEVNQTGHPDLDKILPGPIQLHLKGTPFQLKVWEALLKISSGSLNSYSQLAEQIGHEKASRAVGSAIGANPVAYLIPCHRVIRATGILGEYRWGPTRKQAMIGWEAASCQYSILKL